MNVIITIDGKDYVLSIQETQKICKDIAEQLYQVPKD